MIRVDVIAWCLAAALALTAAGLRLRPRGQTGREQAASRAAAGAALLLILSGAGWRAWLAGGWPSATPADPLAFLAAGALCSLLWQARGRAPRRAAEPWPAYAAGPDLTMVAWGLACAGMVALVAAVIAWRSVLPPTSVAQAHSWLWALRLLPAGIGLGGWLLTVAALGSGSLRLMAVARPAARQRTDANLAPIAAPGGATPDTAHDGATSAADDHAGPARPPSASAGLTSRSGAAVAQVEEPAAQIRRPASPAALTDSTPVPVTLAQTAAASPAVVPGPADHARHAADAGLVALQVLSETWYLVTDALRFSFPWLTFALLAGGAWSMAAFAAPWRGQPAELWQLAAWLLAAGWLFAVSGRHPARLHPALLAILAALGALAALLATWQTPAWFA